MARRTLRTAAMGALLVALAGCAPQAEQAGPEPVPELEAYPSAEETVPETEPPAAPTWSFAFTDVEGYAYDLALSAEVGELASDITTAPPGYADVTLPITAGITVTNSTPGRDAPSDPGLLAVAAVYPASSPLCELPLAWTLNYLGEEGAAYCGLYAKEQNGLFLNSDSDLAAGESRTYDLSGTVTGELPEDLVAQAAADAASPIWTGSLFIGAVPDGTYHCKSGGYEQIVWSAPAIEGC